MPSLRELYFQKSKIKKGHISDSDIRDILIFINRLKSYTDLTMRFDDEILDFEAFESMFNRLQNGEMIQYLLGEASFLGDKFIVDKNVLIPRQETEQLCSLTMDYIYNNFDLNNLTIADICCGSGILGISLAREFRKADVLGLDISEEALNVAKKNNDKFLTTVNFLCGDFIYPLLNNNIKCDVIICNPPYIGDESSVDKRTLENEPHLALFANPKEKFYKILIENIENLMNPHFLIAFEIGEDMKDILETILLENGLKDCYRFQQDLYGKDRFLFIMK